MQRAPLFTLFSRLGSYEACKTSAIGLGGVPRWMGLSNRTHAPWLGGGNFGFPVGIAGPLYRGVSRQQALDSPWDPATVGKKFRARTGKKRGGIRSQKKLNKGFMGGKGLRKNLRGPPAVSGVDRPGFKRFERGTGLGPTRFGIFEGPRDPGQFLPPLEFAARPFRAADLPDGVAGMAFVRGRFRFALGGSGRQNPWPVGRCARGGKGRCSKGQGKISTTGRHRPKGGVFADDACFRGRSAQQKKKTVHNEFQRIALRGKNPPRRHEGHLPSPGATNGRDLNPLDHMAAPDTQSPIWVSQFPRRLRALAKVGPG